jgi:hypothetical protein
MYATMHDVRGSNKAKFKRLEGHVANNGGIGTLVGFKYGKFNEWMLGKRDEGNRIKSGNKRAIVCFIQRMGENGPTHGAGN